MHNYKVSMPFHQAGFPKCRLLLALILLCSLTSCLSSRLTVYTDYLSRESLASFYIETPDPYLNNPVIGQRLIVTWTLKKRHMLYEDLHLKIYVRFRNKKEEIVTQSVLKPQGTYVYALLNEDYITNNGILTYKVELIGDGLIIDEWVHQMWTSLVQIGQNDQNQVTCKEDGVNDHEFDVEDIEF